MRNFFYLLAGILMITSCAVNKDVTNGSWIQKRKYTKGFHLSLKSNKEKTTVVNQDVVINKSEEELAQITLKPRVEVDHHKSTEDIEPSTHQNSDQNSETSSIIQEQHKSEEMNSPVSVEEAPKRNKIKETIAKVYKKNFDHSGIASNNVDEDILLILGIILCLVALSPLGVYIVKGGGSDFTLNLLIWLIAILLSILRAAIWTGFGFGYGLAGLVMLLAVVHGILVILDLI